MKQKVILTGDWDEGLEIVGKILEKSSYEGLRLSHSELKGALKKKISDLIIFCIRAGTEDWTASVDEIKRAYDAFPIFIFAKSVEIDFVVSHIKKGVSEFFVRPLAREMLLARIEREIRFYQLARKIFTGPEQDLDECRFESMLGRSKVMRDNFQIISAVAKSHATVLITGESGTGKELVAQAVHKRSERNAQRFVDINCGASPKELLENELFGHEKGSFTGAHKRYMGSFESAHRGTLFLDEISEMDVMLQVKLLRALQERTITRIGSTEPIKIDVRIIAATNQNLSGLIQAGRFREDLYYRLNVVNIHLPPLRDRRDDIPLLAKNFLDYYSAKNNRIFIDFSQEAMEALINYDWPGNVRELENTVERIVVLHDDSEVKLAHLPPHIQKVNCAIAYAAEAGSFKDHPQVMSLEDLERQAIEAALMKFQGNIAVAAKKLKIGQATLYRKVKKFGLAL